MELAASPQTVRHVSPAARLRPALTLSLIRRSPVGCFTGMNVYLTANGVTPFISYLSCVVRDS